MNLKISFFNLFYLKNFLLKLQIITIEAYRFTNDKQIWKLELELEQKDKEDNKENEDSNISYVEKNKHGDWE